MFSSILAHRISFQSFLERYKVLKESRKSSSKVARKENALSDFMFNGMLLKVTSSFSNRESTSLNVTNLICLCSSEEFLATVNFCFQKVLYFNLFCVCLFLANPLLVFLAFLDPPPTLANCFSAGISLPRHKLHLCLRVLL